MDNYKSTLHDLVHAKRLSLESSDSFPKLKDNSLFCNECSKNMLSYIGVIQDILDIVVGDIAENTSGKNECSHAKTSPNSVDVHPPKRSTSSKKKRKSSNGAPVPASAADYRPTRIPTFAESSYRNASSSQTPPSKHFAEQEVPPYKTFMTPKEQPTIESTDLQADSKDSGTDISGPIVGQLEGLTLRDGTNTHHVNTETTTNTPARGYNENLPFVNKVSLVEGAVQKLHGLQERPPQDKYSQSIPLHQDAHEKVPESLEDMLNKELSSDSVARIFEMTSRLQNEVNATLSEGRRHSPVPDPPSASEELRHSPVLDPASTVSEEQRHSPVLDPASEQAYVTLATTNLSALSCLVLGYSLLAARTSRSLVVLVTEGVCSTLRYHLATVFTIVQSIESLGTRETTTISLLEDPELGISFIKLHVWQLKTFRKCVYLDPDTLVVQNCDELFKRDELSAVPDIGWPDCFNSGVFVYVPSLDTFWDLIEFLENQDSYDGGDQGLLNMYFNNWASDISRKLPFLYNMMANVSYTYKPALKQFGKDVKIVHFFGSYKPWSVPFHSDSGNLLPTANVHPTYVQFVKFWLDIFVSCVMPLFDEDVLNYCHSQVYITVQDLLQFFHSPTTPETLPVQPSFRLYPESMHEDSSGATTPDIPELDASEEDVKVDAEEAETTLPGSELGDYRGMEAWEQGRADYLGQDKSDKIMARLDFLMQGTSKSTEK